MLDTSLGIGDVSIVRVSWSKAADISLRGAFADRRGVVPGTKLGIGMGKLRNEICASKVRKHCSNFVDPTNGNTGFTNTPIHQKKTIEKQLFMCLMVLIEMEFL